MRRARRRRRRRRDGRRGRGAGRAARTCRWASSRRGTANDFVRVQRPLARGRPGSQPNTLTSAPCARIARRAARGRALRPRPGWRSARRAPGEALDSARSCSTRIDHIGVAVADLEAAIALHERTYGMPVAHRETVGGAGRRGGAARRRREPRRAAAPLADDTPVGRFLAQRGPGLHHVAYQVADIDAALAPLRERRRAADRRGAADRHPRLARRVPAPGGERGGAHRARRASYAPRMTARRAAIGFQGGQVLSLRVSEEQLTELRQALAQATTAAGARSRRPTAPSCWTSPRSCTCASSPTSTASASSPPGAEPPRPRQRARPRALPARAQRRPHAATRALGAVATRGWGSTARSGSPPARPGSRSTAGAAAAGRARPPASAPPT